MLRSSRPYGSVDDGATRGRVRASAVARPAIRMAATASGARQPRASARIPEAVRASSIPIRTPLMTVPTTRPRSASGARMLAKGIRIWTTTEVVAATPRAAASAATPGAAAASAIPAPLTRSRVTTSRPPVEQVAEGHQEHQAGGVRDLRDGHQQPGGRLRDAEGAGDRRQQRLHVVEVRHGRPTRDGQQHDHAAGGGPAARARVGDGGGGAHGPRNDASAALRRPRAAWVAGA